MNLNPVSELKIFVLALSRAPPEPHVQCLGAISKTLSRRDQARLAFSNAWKTR